MKQGSNSWTEEQSDGVIDVKTSFQAHENRIYTQTTHNKRARKLILERNQRLRIEQPYTATARKDMRIMLTIPEGDLPALNAEFPDLESLDSKLRSKATMALASAYPEYISYNRSDNG